MGDYLDRVRVRVAPSPTGAPHVGTAYIALFDYVFARQAGGDFILRIEDTDRARSTRESEDAILRALRWIGLDWDEGPDVGGPCGPYRQSERSDIYRDNARKLLETGAVYRCFCTPERLARMREDRARSGIQGGYDRLCRGLSRDEVKRNIDAGTPFTLRLKTPLEGETRFDDMVRGQVTFKNSEVEDLILLKSDGFPTYHLANVVDDHLMRISHVVRAEEWISSTPKHILIYQAFGWQIPRFIHMPLLRNRDKSKISKRKNPVSLDWYREQGFLPEALRNFLALMGWSLGEEREMFSLAAMIENFSWDRVKTSGPVFDLQKLEWLNGEYIRAIPAEDLLGRLIEEPYTDRADAPAELMLAITRLVQERMKRLAEFDGLTGFFFEREPYDPGNLIPKKQQGDFVRRALRPAIERLEACPDWSVGPLEEAMRLLAEELECKRGALYMVLRVAVTCRKVSTPLFETMEVLGRDECLARLELARQSAAGLP